MRETGILVNIVTSCWLWPPQRSERGQQPSKEHWDASQIPVSFPLASPSAPSNLGNAAIVQRAPELPLSSPPSLSLLFSQRAKRGNACAAALPSSVSAKLSLASHEKQWNFIWDQITKKRGGGGGECSKGVRNCGIKKKAEGFCLFSVAVIFGEVCRSAFLGSIGGTGEDLGLYDQASGCQTVQALFYTHFFCSFLLLFLPVLKKKSLGHLCVFSPSVSLDAACLNWLIGQDLGWMEAQRNPKWRGWRWVGVQTVITVTVKQAWKAWMSRTTASLSNTHKSPHKYSNMLGLGYQKGCPIITSTQFTIIETRMAIFVSIYGGVSQAGTKPEMLSVRL